MAIGKRINYDKNNQCLLANKNILQQYREQKDYHFGLNGTGTCVA